MVRHTTYYITIEERNKLYHTNLDHNPAFARNRVTDGVAEANAKEIDEDMKRDLVSMLE